LLNALLEVAEHAPIPTWFGVGGRADRLARPESVDSLRQCVETDPDLRILGDGANLLVDDEGVGELVLDMGGLRSVEIDGTTGRVVALAGADLPRLVVESVRRGLAGLEGLGGIPATLGGAVMMNAGGVFGQIADAVAAVHALDREGRAVVMPRELIDFGYRRSGLRGLVIAKVELELRPVDPVALRARLKEVMAYKKASQPMAERSAGCAFKNPTLGADLEGVGAAGARVSAGMLIDRAGAKGLRRRSAQVSPVHGNFLTADAGGRARDVIELMDQVHRRVMDRFGIGLEPEVVIWRRAQ
jgi:UDP-N-acetylmuramate dehydrogenase